MQGSPTLMPGPSLSAEMRLMKGSPPARELGLVKECRDPDGTQWPAIYRGPTGYIVKFEDLVEFEIPRAGTEVLAWPALHAPSSRVRHVYANQVLPLFLSMRGHLVFHGSAVEIGGTAVGFVGGSGQGKSTLAASFASVGYRFLTDDALVLEDGLSVRPGEPSIRLWDDSAMLLGDRACAGPAWDWTAKARFLACEVMAHCPLPRPLRQIYFLGQGSQGVRIEALTPSMAALELVRHSFLMDVTEHPMIAAQFANISDISTRLSFSRLHYPMRFERLAEVRAAVLDHMSCLEQ